MKDTAMYTFGRFSITAGWIAVLMGSALADPTDAWRGVLYTCGTHPTVHIPANVVYAYEKDLTHYTEGKVSFKGASMTLSFPGKYGTFTITRRGRHYFSGATRCTVDQV